LGEILILAVGLSMDAFAVAICIGLAMGRVTLRKSLTVGLWFGVFQAGMPLIGFFIARWFAAAIIAYDHWVVFGLLCFLGGKMIAGSFRGTTPAAGGGHPSPEGNDQPGSAEDTPSQKEAGTTPSGGAGHPSPEGNLRAAKMLPLALATSVDALAVGVSFAFLQTDIVPAVSVIGVTTLLLSMLGVKIGSVFGERFRAKAEFLGGLILVLIGVRILLEHLREAA